jgi:hypothetical protein
MQPTLWKNLNYVEASSPIFTWKLGLHVRQTFPICFVMLLDVCRALMTIASTDDNNISAI